jgi:CRP/FNR family transcriptional regulator
MIRELPECLTCHNLQKSCFANVNTDYLSELKYEKACSLYRKGQIIFQEDNRALGIYCLYSGNVKLFKYGPDGREQIVRIVLPGHLFGYRALVGSRLYCINAQALTDTAVCFFTAENFIQIARKIPEITHQIIISLSDLLEDTENQLTSLAKKSVRERLAETLLRLSGGQADPDQTSDRVINLSREDLANMVGSATETVIRLLSEFREDKLIAISGRKIHLLDIAGLQKVAHAHVNGFLKAFSG